MNPTSLMNMAMLYFQLNMGASKEAKVVLAEGMDVIAVMTKAMKDNKITSAEKKALVKELKEFSKAAITLLDNITIPS